MLAALLFLVLGFGAWLQIPQLLTQSAGNLTGATYADVHARMPALWVLVGAALLSAALALWQAFTIGRLLPIAAAAGLYLVVSVGGSAYAASIQRFVVATERAGSGDAVHHPQHPGYARRVRPRRRAPSGR